MAYHPYSDPVIPRTGQLLGPVIHCEVFTVTVNANKQKVTALIAEIKAHCMCAKFEDDGWKYLILYPPGFQLDGCQAVYRQSGKAAALERLLLVIERHWREDFAS